METHIVAQRKPPTVSVIIKAFNEEAHIADAIESALAAIESLDGEVILADGASTDRTIAIAQKYPIKIVQLDNPEDRSCGAGSQLGYQYCSGDFVCLMDGDMVLHGDFLSAAIRFLAANPDVGGVGGAKVDRNEMNLEYIQRAARFDPDRLPGQVTRLNGSGLYRRAAIESVGYATDRNLHGSEELELAARLQARGWTLARIDCPAINHYVHTGNAFRLLLRRVWTRNSFAAGEIARASVGQPHFGFVLRNDRTQLLCGLVMLWWLTIVAFGLLADTRQAVVAAVIIVLLPFAIMSVRWRSLANGVYSVAVWNVFTLCFLPGLLRRRASPRQWVASTVIQDPAVASANSSPIKHGITRAIARYQE